MNRRPAPPYRWEFDGLEWLTAQQMVEELGLALRQVHWRCQRGDIPAVQDRSRRWHVHRDDLERVRAMPWYQASLTRKAGDAGG